MQPLMCSLQPAAAVRCLCAALRCESRGSPDPSPHYNMTKKTNYSLSNFMWLPNLPCLSLIQQCVHGNKNKNPYLFRIVRFPPVISLIISLGRYCFLKKNSQSLHDLVDHGSCVGLYSYLRFSNLESYLIYEPKMFAYSSMESIFASNNTAT